MNIKNICKNFEKNGFVVVKNFLKKSEIKKVFTQLNDLINVPISTIDPSLTDKLSLDEKYILLKKRNPKLKSHFYDMIRFMDSVNQITNSKRLLKVSKKIMKESSVAVGTSQVRIDHVSDPYWLPQHQELGQMSTKCTLFYIPLVNLKKKTGGLYVRPKTHKLGFVPYKGHDNEGKAYGPGRQKIIEKLFKKPDLKKYKNHYIKLNAGDAVIFHNYLFHGTLPNLDKEKIRWVYIVRYYSINKIPYLKNPKSPLSIPYTANYHLL
tara:strand:- start:68 stop:862 length:795 start_codon:yes stop_codon:yes gene_type:complete